MLFSKLTKHGTRLALALILGLALVGSLPVPAQAQGPIDLVLGGEGATSWNIVNIQPGDSGTKTVELRNAGSRSGFVTIWISDIVSSEGNNPESETGDTAEPGELGDYLVFNLSGSRLRTNLSLAATIDNFPQSASDSDYIKVSPLFARETVILVWEWEFPETGEPQNDAQGDSLSFTINYLLEELPSGGGGGGGGGAPPPPTPTPTPTATPTPTPTPTPMPIPTPTPGTGVGLPLGAWAGIAVGIAALLGLGVLLVVRRRNNSV